MEIPDRLFETILLAVRDAAEEVENGNLTVTDIPVGLLFGTVERQSARTNFGSARKGKNR